MILNDIQVHKRCFKQLVLVVLPLLFVGSYAYADGTIKLHDVTSETGITFKHTDGSSGRLYIVETVTAGVVLFDYDRDGDIDIYFVNGAPILGTPKPDIPPKNMLYRNDGNFRFTDVTDNAGVGDTGFGEGAAAGDYDNDGDLDLYVSNYGANILYRNNGDGTFTDVTKKAGVDCGFQVGAGVCFLDMDADGDLDLFVSSYVDFSYERPFQKVLDGVPVYPGPRSYERTPNVLYRNNGDGTFTDVSKISGVAEAIGYGMGMVCADYDNDGDTDIFVANDTADNFLFENDGRGKFEETGLIAGVACDLNGKEMGSMGVSCGDYDNDGLLDFYVTSYQSQLTQLYKNLGDGVFEDVIHSTGAGAGTYNHVTWGPGFADFDNDGDRDIFVAAGHIQESIVNWDNTTSYLVKNLLYENNGNGKFVNVSEKSGDGLQVELSSRGAAFDDLDNDGDIDVVIVNSRRESTILRNDTPAKGHWLGVQLRGAKSNRDGVGAHVIVTAGDLTLIDEVHSGHGYQGHYGMRLHFGLGKHDKIDRIELRWIGGTVDVFENIAVDRFVTLTEGSSKKSGQNSE